MAAIRWGDKSAFLINQEQSECTKQLYILRRLSPICAAFEHENGGSDFSKPPLFIGLSHDFSNAKPITTGNLPYVIGSASVRLAL